MSTTPILHSSAAIQAVFDALDAFLAESGYTGSNASVTLDGAGQNHTISGNDRAGNSETYSNRVAGIRINVKPPMVTLGPGGTQTFTADATNPDGSPVPSPPFTWSLQSGALGTLDTTNAVYHAPAEIAAATTDYVTCTLAGGASWSQASVSLVPALP